tara:strand:+ start:352 stop:639 length:288 start_codon:yes stop_codon:yes gene_type:complete
MTEQRELAEAEAMVNAAIATVDSLTSKTMSELTDQEIKVNFYDRGDAYGKSWMCKECGNYQFYTPKPVRCPHMPLWWEVKMKEQAKAKRARKLNK